MKLFNFAPKEHRHGINRDGWLAEELNRLDKRILLLEDRADQTLKNSQKEMLEENLALLRRITDEPEKDTED